MILPEALCWNIDYDLFWRLNPKTLKPFGNAYRLKQERDYDSDNRKAWMSGLYVARAIAANFGKGKKYPEKPIEFYQKDSEGHLVQTEEDKARMDAERFEAWAIAFNAKMKF